MTTPPVTLEEVPLTGPQAHRLADMAGVHMDLRWTAAACMQLLRRQRGHHIDSMCIDGIHDTAIIRYGRCFKTGKRNAFYIPEQWLTGLPPRLKRAHKDAISLRDKHVAHSVNDWEVNVPIALVARTGKASAVRSVSIRQMRALLGTDPLQDLHEVAKTLADRVQDAMAEQAS